MKLTATILPYNADATITWSSSDNAIATVDNYGTVSAYTVGTATITAQAGDKTATCTVTVHFHSYSGGKCTVCGAVQDFNGTIDENGVLTYYWGNESSVTIPDSVTSIGEKCFQQLHGLESVTIPNSVERIEKYAFAGCTSLTVMTIPDSVTSIGDYAFYQCTSLTSVTIPTSVTSIGIYAFEACPNLTDVTIGNGVTSIEDYAFGWCTSLTSVTIPDSVTSIEDYAFSNCTSLTVMTIPDSVTRIGSSAFEGCTSLDSVFFSGTKERWNQIVGNSEMSGCDIVQCTDGYWLNPNCWIIEDGVLTHYYGNKATVEIPDSVTRIGTSAFQYCMSPTSVTIPDSVTSIDDYAFQYCMSLTSVTIPTSVTSIGEDAFNNCTSLAEIQFEGTKAQWEEIEGCNNVAVACVRCSDGNIDNPKYLVTSVTLDKNTLTLTCGETAKLTATVTPSNSDNKTVSWSSSNTSVATVDNDGTVTACAEGTATITAQAGGKTATCTVTVKPSFIAVESVTLNQTTLTLTRNETATLTATVIPSSADDKTVTWSSSNTSIATVSNTGMVTAVKVGTATITAQAGGRTATCAVTVKPSFIAVESVTLNQTTLTLKRNETAKLTATVYPDNADNKTVTWTSSNISVATVDNDGTVTAVEAGYATITARVGDKTAQCTVHIHSYSGGKCTLCGDVPQLTGGTIDENGVLTKYKYERCLTSIS